MMETTANEETKAVLMLALGNSKKEVANKLNKSIHTVGKQANRYYRKNNIRNLADLTRHIINRYSGIKTEQIIINALGDIAVIVAVWIGIWLLLQCDVLEMAKTSLVFFLINNTSE